MSGSKGRVWILALFFCATLLAAPRASAHAAHLEWSAPAPCGDVVALRSAVERLLGEPLEEGSTFRVDAKVTADADARFSLTLSIRTPENEGSRSVRGDTCDSVLEVAAFSIALAINPELAAENPEPAATADSPPAPVPTAVPAEPATDAPPTRLEPEPKRAPTPAASPELWLGAHALGDSSLLPSVAFGAEVSADLLLFDYLRFGAGGELFLPQATSLADGRGGLFSLWSVEAHGCGQMTLGVEAALCPLVRFAELRGEGRAVSPRLAQTSRIYAPGVALLGLLGLSRRLSLSLRLVGLLPLSRDVFVIKARPVHRLPPASVELGLGIAVRAF